MRQLTHTRLHRQKVHPNDVTFPTGWALTDAIHDVDCPRCFAPKGFYCMTPKGRKADPPHVSRLKHYREVIGAEEFNRRHHRP